MPPWRFFAMVAAIAAIAGALLLALVPRARAVDPGARAEAAGVGG